MAYNWAKFFLVVIKYDQYTRHLKAHFKKNIISHREPTRKHNQKIRYTNVIILHSNQRTGNC